MRDPTAGERVRLWCGDVYGRVAQGRRATGARAVFFREGDGRVLGNDAADP